MRIITREMESSLSTFWEAMHKKLSGSLHLEREHEPEPEDLKTEILSILYARGNNDDEL